MATAKKKTEKKVKKQAVGLRLEVGGKKTQPARKATAGKKAAAKKAASKKKASASRKAAKPQSKKTVSKKTVRKKTGEAASPPKKKKPVKKKPAPKKKKPTDKKPDPPNDFHDETSDTAPREVCPMLKSGLDQGEIGLDLVKVGPPRKWDDRAAFIKAVNAWIAKRKKRLAWKFEKKQGLVQQPDPKPLHIASLCNHLGITPRTFLRWREDEEHPLYGICQQVMVAIEADLWDQDGGMAKLNLQSNFGHRSKADITTAGEALPNQAPLSIDPSKLSTAELKQYMKIVRKGSPGNES